MLNDIWLKKDLTPTAFQIAHTTHWDTKNFLSPVDFIISFYILLPIAPYPQHPNTFWLRDGLKETHTDTQQDTTQLTINKQIYHPKFYLIMVIY